MSEDEIYLGLDIGTANTKGILLIPKQDQLGKNTISYKIFNFPNHFVKGTESNRIKALISGLERIKEEIYQKMNLTLTKIGIVQSFPYTSPDKESGLITVIDCINQVFNDTKSYFIDNNWILYEINAIKEKLVKKELSNEELMSLIVNFQAGACYVASKLAPEGISVDIGSASTTIFWFNQDGLSLKDIIQRLATGESIWYGYFHTPIEAFCPNLPFNGNLSQTVPRGLIRTLELYEILDEETIIELLQGYNMYEIQEKNKIANGIADYFFIIYSGLLKGHKYANKIAALYAHTKFINVITEKLILVASQKNDYNKKIPLVISGLGTKMYSKEFSAERYIYNDFFELIDYQKLLPDGLSLFFPAFGSALIVGNITSPIKNLNFNAI